MRRIAAIRGLACLGLARLGLSCLGLAWLSVGEASGQAAKGGNPFGTNIFPSSYSVEATASADTPPLIHDDDFDTDVQNPAEASFVASSSVTAASTNAGDSAESTADYSVSFVLDTETGMLSGTVTASIDGTAMNSDTNESSPIAEPRVSFESRIVIEDAPATLQLFGPAAASGMPLPSLGCVRVELINSEGVAFDRLVCGEGGPSSDDIEVSIPLEPGGYTLRIHISGEAYFDDDEDLGSAFCSASLSLDVMIVPAEGADITWVSTEDGDFDNAENWDRARVPSSADTALFASDGLYDVLFNSSESSRRALIDDTLVRFVGGSYVLGGGTETEPSLVIGHDSTGSDVLAIVGNQLSSVFASIGHAVGSDSTVGVIDGGTWNNSARLVVGRSGVGSLDNGIDGSGRIATGELRIGENAQSTGTVDVYRTTVKQGVGAVLVAGATAVGYFGQGTLTVHDAEIETGQTSIGALFGSRGEVVLDGANGSSRWVFGGELRVGDQGDGVLSVRSGAVESLATDRVVVGFLEGSTGLVTLDGSDARLQTFSEIAVGTEGEGDVQVRSGASVSGSALIIGPSAGPGEGIVTVSGSETDGAATTFSTITVDEDLSVGAGGAGTLTIDGGRVFADSADLGTFASGNATVDVSDGGILEISGALRIGESAPPAIAGTATVKIVAGSDPFSFVIADSVTMEAGSSVHGNGGVLRAANGFTNNGGTVGAGITVDAKQGGELGPLMIDGDFTMTDGVIEIVASGLGDGEFGALQVSGDADIQSAEVHFVFADGFAPRTDDVTPFLMVEGDLNIGTLSQSYEGVADGFEFEIETEGGMLVFRALNDAERDDMMPGPGCASSGSGSNVRGGTAVMLIIVAAIAWRFGSSRAHRRVD